MVINVHVKYYALMREERGLSEEQLQTEAQDAQALYNDLKTKHGFKLDTNILKVAINDEFSDWCSKLKDGDSIIFIPPVAGG